MARAQLAPHGRVAGAAGKCLGRRPAGAGFLGPPRVLSSVATSESPFVCPFIQKSGCNCVGHKAPVALTSHPCQRPSRERVSQAPCEGRLLAFPGSRRPTPSSSGPRTCSFSPHQFLHPRGPSRSHRPLAHWSVGAHPWTHTAGGSCAKHGETPGRCPVLRSPVPKRFQRVC